MLETLYKKTKTGAIQQWEVRCEGNCIIVTQGQVDGAKQEYKTYCQGKNKGKANETSDEQQAELEAQSKWNKQVKKGYVTSPSGESNKKLPMRLKNYWDNKKNVKFPCTVSPKLNGVNGTFWLIGDEVVLTSRGGEDYKIPQKMGEEAKHFMSITGIDCINGEIYCHGMHLQDITSAVKKPNENSDKLKFCVFEYPNDERLWEDKYQEFNDILSFGHNYTHLDFVSSVVADNHNEIEKWHDFYVQQGYEGVVIRNMGCVYKFNERNSHAFKMKVAIDKEFKIARHKVDKLGHPVFTCLTPEGLEFEVKPKGTDAERKAVLNDVDNWIGKWLKVEFESYSKEMKPTKPVGIGLRDCDKQGNPLE